MVINILTEQKIEVGHQLVAYLDTLNLSLKAAFWLLDSSTGRWRLILSFPLLHQRGSRYFYKKIQSHILKYPDRPISLQDISLVDYTEPIINRLKSTIKIGPDISRARFVNCQINGIQVDEALVYRMT